VLIGSRCLAATTSHRATCEGTRGARELELGFVCAYVRAGGGHDMKEGVAARRGRAPHLTTITLRIGPRISRGRSRSAIGFLWTGRGRLPTCCSKISRGFRHNFNDEVMRTFLGKRGNGFAPFMGRMYVGFRLFWGKRVRHLLMASTS
jgi:hypothetical protein